MDRNLALEVARATEAAALAAARFIGKGDVAEADRAACEAMRKALNSIAMDGKVVVGEGERGASDLLYEGEIVGSGSGPQVDVALDALEGALICAMGGPNALSCIALAERGRLLRCPNTYMDKVACGPAGVGVIDLDRSPTDNLKALAEAKKVYVEDLRVAILDRPRHEKLIREVRRAGAAIKLLSAGDLSAAVATTHPESDIDILLGVGGAHQGILASAAIRSSGGEMQCRFAPRNEDEAERCLAAGIFDLKHRYTLEELAGDNVMFAATGVTTGDYLKGVRFFSGGAYTHSVVMRSKTRTVRFINAIHHFDFKPEY
ncbi:MAG: class II fructose-bisphosphatase [Deltaproteobacteria bacterium]|jgi:fructose-1,6-bisphosphatase II|nr:class II fructose-bisphosphatase [Deltaproteobacteria bacterium]